MSRMKSFRSDAMTCAVYLQLALAAACSHPAPQKPAPVERPVKAVADLAGKWAASDEVDFAYRLSIAPDGEYELTIDRNREGTCEIKGTLELPRPADAPARTFSLTYRINDCKPQLKGITEQLAVESFTDAGLVLVVAGDRHVFARQ